MANDDIGKFDFSSVFSGAIASIIISLLALAIIAIVLQFTEFPGRLIEPAVKVASLIGPLCGGFIAVKRINSFGWLNGGAAGFVCVFFLYIIGGFAGHDFSIGIPTLIMLLLSCLAGAIGGILGINTRYRY